MIKFTIGSKKQYFYRARCLRVVDGDSCVFSVDLGFGIYKEDHFRLLGIDAPETKRRVPGMTDGEWAEELEAGRRSTAWLRERVEGKEVFVRTEVDRQKHGRYLATLYLPVDGQFDPGQNINEKMVIDGFARRYNP